ncbi:hypothetical protein ACVIHI_008958 [Bradyrhizobium sp. USDA 4524]|uniref:hypothetical protein n=1 Tax=unclassified Bradyrhizobium TaxID=2631580 RepID=UPI0020A1E680|nr:MULTISPECIES: hypothetical protein [unclassified Bradyrhizobium]MCP1845575.1 hypothetical protein [Bradyrhizobium sp. USDA 4538]MCP1907103.1 hypothetical protein [Bradyrhizobium sp. USDA 4537]MCP1985578.1 hypothetical protein [Bradyrhizobium sp. USDA 4539]
MIALIPGVTNQDLWKVPGRGIAHEGGAEIADDEPAHVPELRGKFARQIDCIVPEAGREVLANEERGVVDLVTEPVESGARTVADEEVDILAVGFERTIRTRE